MAEQDYVSNCFRPTEDEIEAERVQERDTERERESDRDIYIYIYWKDGPFVKSDGTSTEASRNEPKAVEK